MKKFTSIIFFVAAALFAGTAIAEDSYLYFMVSDAQFGNGEKANFDYATLSVDNGESYLSLYNTSGSALGTKVASDGANSTAMANLGFGYYAGFSGDASISTFLVELWSFENDGTLVAYQTFEGASISEYIYGGTSGGGSSPLVVSSVVPEPTSVILLLLGVAALSLKRKNATNQV